jgi:predicted nucleic acid-binding protein
MKIFLDANILVTVLCNEYPDFTYCSRVLSLCDNRKFEIYTSPICLAIAYYFAEKKNGTRLANTKIALLTDKLRIAPVDESAVKKAASNKSIEDFEDGMKYYAALHAGCKCIITHDKDDFYFSEMEVLKPEEFLLKHVARNK